jgi:putative ABC transport system permease protein
MLKQSLRMAWKAITGNKGRSLLTMLGVIIGVLSVVVLVSLVNAATSQVTGQIKGLGSNMLMVSIKSNRYTPLNMDEIGALKNQPGIAAVSPSITGSASVKYGTEKMDGVSIDGASPEVQLIRDLSAAEGRFLLSPDIDNASSVAVIGVNVATTLFGADEPVGKTISVNGRQCQVIGVLASKGQSMMGSDDDKIIVPATLAQRMFPEKGIRMFYVAASSPETVADAQQTLNTMLLAKYRNDTDAFQVISQSNVLDTVSSITGTMTLLLGGIAGISLVVGGIGIMNIMLVSVTERTREIGIRKAIGAKRKHILMQFLIEALMISLSGGIIGLVLSWLIVMVLSGAMGMAISITIDVVALALGFSLGVGLVFGIYPANRASKLLPIEALRYEG